LGRSADQAGYDFSFSNSDEYVELTNDAITQFLSDVPLDGYILV